MTIKIPMSRIFIDLTPPTPDIILKKKGNKVVCEEINPKKLISNLNRYKPRK